MVNGMVLLTGRQKKFIKMLENLHNLNNVNIKKKGKYMMSGERER